MNIYQNEEQQIEVHHVPESERLFPMWDLNTVKTNAPEPSQSELADSRAQPSEPDRDGPDLGYC